MIRVRRNLILTEEIINLTDDMIYMYEESSGILRRFPPSIRGLPSKPRKSYFRWGVPSKEAFYVVDEERYKKLKKTRRSLEDVAVILSQPLGAGDIPITYLFWAKDSKQAVRLCPRTR